MGFQIVADPHDQVTNAKVYRPDKRFQRSHDNQKRTEEQSPIRVGRSFDRGNVSWTTQKPLRFRSMKFYFEFRNGDEQEKEEPSKNTLRSVESGNGLPSVRKKTAPPWVAVENLLAKHL